MTAEDARGKANLLIGQWQILMLRCRQASGQAASRPRCAGIMPGYYVHGWRGSLANISVAKATVGTSSRFVLLSFVPMATN